MLQPSTERHPRGQQTTAPQRDHGPLLAAMLTCDGQEQLRRELHFTSDELASDRNPSMKLISATRLYTSRTKRMTKISMKILRESTMNLLRQFARISWSTAEQEAVHRMVIRD
jgi:hypothetical protein